MEHIVYILKGLLILVAILVIVALMLIIVYFMCSFIDNYYNLFKIIIYIFIGVFICWAVGYYFTSEN